MFEEKKLTASRQGRSCTSSTDSITQNGGQSISKTEVTLFWQRKISTEAQKGAWGGKMPSELAKEMVARGMTARATTGKSNGGDAPGKKTRDQTKSRRTRWGGKKREEKTTESAKPGRGRDL